MNELEKILNAPESPIPTEVVIPKPIVKPTPAANRANGLAAQDDTIASASIGSRIYRSASNYLADNPAPVTYK
jgi:hypothetical protein